MRFNALSEGRGMKFVAFAFLVSVVLLLASCGSKGGGDSVLPDGGRNMTDSEKVAYVMKTSSPDSVARFICNASLGKLPGAKIDTMANAMLYAYETYSGDDLQTFSQAMETFTESLPLDMKMRLRKLEAEQDPMGLGYQLGLEYVNVIRTDKKDSATIEKEIAALRKECRKSAEDTATFTRFMKGFKVALEMDGSSDIPKDIYSKYSR